MARAIWKGVLRFGDVSVPVKLYSAVEDRAVHFRLLHEKDLQPVRQQMVNPETGKVVSSEHVRHGVEVERGLYVVLDDVEIEGLEPPPSRDIEITRFVPANAIDPAWYERPYYLGPDRDAPAYFALARALVQQEKEGVARWVMRNRSYVGALRPEGDYLMLIALRHAGEVIPAGEVEAPGGRQLEPREARLAKQLVASLEGEFDPDDYRDEFRDRVLALVHAKASGKKVPRRRVKRKRPARDLAASLEASLERAKKEKAVA
jgi:DNA end-binding protein Ku